MHSHPPLSCCLHKGLQLSQHVPSRSGLPKKKHKDLAAQCRTFCSFSLQHIRVRIWLRIPGSLSPASGAVRFYLLATCWQPFTHVGPTRVWMCLSRVCTTAASLLGGLGNLVSGMAGSLLSNIHELKNIKAARVARLGLTHLSASVSGHVVEG